MIEISAADVDFAQGLCLLITNVIMLPPNHHAISDNRLYEKVHCIHVRLCMKYANIKLLPK